MYNSLPKCDMGNIFFYLSTRDVEQCLGHVVYSISVMGESLKRRVDGCVITNVFGKSELGH